MSQPGILLMAAGLSRRYQARCGRHKLAETLPGTAYTVFEHTFNTARSTRLNVHVVLRPETEPFAEIIRQWRMDYSVLHSDGLGESISSGVQATPHWPGWIILLADMPYLQSQTILLVSEALQQTVTARPCWQGQPGHPVGFRAECREALLALHGDDGAKAVLRHWPAQCITVADPGCIKDIDTPEQLYFEKSREE